LILRTYAEQIELLQSYFLIKCTLAFMPGVIQALGLVYMPKILFGLKYWELLWLKFMSKDVRCPFFKC